MGSFSIVFRIKELLKSKDSFFIRHFYNLSRFVYHGVKNLGYSIAPLSHLLDTRAEIKTKRKEDLALFYVANRGYKVLNIEQVYENFKHRKNDICHIIAGGWSFNLSGHKINKNDFTIGMNYSALSNLKFDVYFIEQGLADDIETKIRTKIIDEIVSKQTAAIYYKNIYGHNSVDYVIDHYASRVNFIKSYPVFCSNEKNIVKTMRRFLEYDALYLKQFKSTAISSVVFAKHIGFKEIVLHGLDFGGAYFYEEKELEEGKRKYIPPKNSLSRGKQKHQTVLSSCGVDKILPVISNLLLKEGVNLYAGSSKSPSSKYLKVYKVN